MALLRDQTVSTVLTRNNVTFWEQVSSNETFQAIVPMRVEDYAIIRLTESGCSHVERTFDPAVPTRSKKNVFFL